MPTPGSSPSGPAQKRTPRSARVPPARSPRPLGRPVTLTGGLPGSGLRPVTRPRPPRRERLPRAGTGSRAGQVGVSAAPTHPGPPDPVRPGRPPIPAGCTRRRCCSARRPHAGPDGDPGPPTPQPGHLGTPDGGAQDWGAGGGRTRRGAHTRRGRGKGDGDLWAPRVSAPLPGPQPSLAPCPPHLADGRRADTRGQTRGRGNGHAGADTRTRTRGRSRRALPPRGPALQGAGRGAHPAERASGGVTCAAR